MKIILIGILIALTVLFIVITYAAHFFAGIMVQRNNKWFDKVGHKLANPDIDQDSDDPYYIIEQRQNKEADKYWEDDCSEVLNITSFDGLNLVGRMYRNKVKTNKWVIGVHGYRSTGKRDMQVITSHLYENGYNTLVPDLRAHGASEGQTITMGYNEKKDIVQWIETLVKMEPDCEIVLYGGSMGGTIVMLASGEEIPPNVKLIIADCGFTTADMEFSSLINRVLGLPSFPMMNLINMFVKQKAKFSLKDVDVRPALNTNYLPLLTIHGTKDAFVPHEMAYYNNEASRGPKEILMVENAPHLSSYIYDEKHYFETVYSFLDSYL